MARASRGVKARRRHNRWLKLAKGAHYRRHKTFRAAKTTVEKALRHAYRDRRKTKRNYRSLWIVRINAAARQFGLSYSRFMAGLKKHAVEIDRKILADLAIHDPQAMSELATLAKS
jgi:large subunit ribosomal protein L20